MDLEIAIASTYLQTSEHDEDEEDPPRVGQMQSQVREQADAEGSLVSLCFCTPTAPVDMSDLLANTCFCGEEDPAQRTWSTCMTQQPMTFSTFSLCWNGMRDLSTMQIENWYTRARAWIIS